MTGLILLSTPGRIVSITAQVSRGFPGMVHTGAARAGIEVRNTSVHGEFRELIEATEPYKDAEC